MATKPMKFQFSLRFLILTLSIASIASVIWAYHYRRVIHRLRAISNIERDSGHITFRDNKGGLVLEATNAIRLQNPIESIYLAGSQLDLKTLEGLKWLEEVEFLSFNSSAFSDDHVRHLNGLPALRVLQLNGTQITAAGLEHLSQHHQLSQLALNDTAIDDTAIEPLANMKPLRSLYLRHTNISEVGVFRLKLQLPECRIER